MRPSNSWMEARSESREDRDAARAADGRRHAVDGLRSLARPRAPRLAPAAAVARSADRARPADGLRVSRYADQSRTSRRARFTLGLRGSGARRRRRTDARFA